MFRLGTVLCQSFRSSLKEVIQIVSKDCTKGVAGFIIYIILLARHYPFRLKAEGDRFDPWGRHPQFSLHVTVSSLKLVIEMHLALKGQ